MNDNEAKVLLQRDGAVATLVMNRAAQRNALDIPTAKEFLARCTELAADSGVRAVVLKADGKNFGVGGDLAALRVDSPNTARELVGTMHQAIRLLTNMDAPVIASIQGAVAGGSLSLSLACDLAVAADTAKFNMAYINVAVSCDLSGSWNLPRVVGLRNAMGLALLGDTFDANEALRLGLINKVVPEAELEQATCALARRIAAGPAVAMGRTKRLLRASFNNDLNTHLDRELESFVACAGTSDFAEALDAFFGKRAPEFKGR